MTGTLSRHPISWPQVMHAEPGETSERRSGTRAATTFMKLPRASPGASAKAASVGISAGYPQPCGRVASRRLGLDGGCGRCLLVACELLGALERDEEIVSVRGCVRGGLA